MGKGANEPVTDTHPNNLTDVFDAEAPEQAYSKTREYTTHVGKGIRETDSESDTDVRVLSPDHQLALEKQRQRREREPLLYCKLITRWPVQSFRKLFIIISYESVIIRVYYCSITVVQFYILFVTLFHIVVFINTFFLKFIRKHPVYRVLKKVFDLFIFNISLYMSFGITLI